MAVLLSNDEYLNKRKSLLAWQEICPESQHESETMLPHIMKHIVSSSMHHCDDFVNDISALIDCISRSVSAVQYVMRNVQFVQRLLTMLSDIAKHNSMDKAVGVKVEGTKGITGGDTLPNISGNEAYCINTILRAVCILIGGSQANKQVWQDVTSNLDLEAILDKGTPEMQEVYAGNIFDMAIYLKIIHDCTIKVGSKVQSLVDEVSDDVKKAIAGMSATDHLQIVLNSFQLELVYAEFCSCPGCAEKDRDHSFKRCSRCKLSRYCSQKCQKHHWTKCGHKLDCSTA